MNWFEPITGYSCDNVPFSWYGWRQQQFLYREKKPTNKALISDSFEVKWNFWPEELMKADEVTWDVQNNVFSLLPVKEPKVEKNVWVSDLVGKDLEEQIVLLSSIGYSIDHKEIKEWVTYAVFKCRGRAMLVVWWQWAVELNHVVEFDDLNAFVITDFKEKWDRELLGFTVKLNNEYSFYNVYKSGNRLKWSLFFTPENPDGKFADKATLVASINELYDIDEQIT